MTEKSSNMKLNSETVWEKPDSRQITALLLGLCRKAFLCTEPREMLKAREAPQSTGPAPGPLQPSGQDVPPQ